MTRGSVTGQVKALSMIVAMENFIPDRRAVSSEKKSAPPPNGQIYAAACAPRGLREQQGKTIDPQPSPDLAETKIARIPTSAHRGGRRAFGPCPAPALL